MSKYILKLFINGNSRKSEAAIANLKKLCGYIPAGNFETSIIDLQAGNYANETNEILAVPLLIKLEPSPTKRIVGDLSETLEILKCMEIPFE